MGTVDIGAKYEKYCMRLLELKGYTNINGTKASGDQGIDIIAYRDGIKFGFQCKYYSSPVGNHAVQEAFAGGKYYCCNVAVVITNTIFTEAAKKLAANTGVVLWEQIEMQQSTTERILNYYNLDIVPNYYEMFSFYRSLNSLDIYTNLFLSSEIRETLQVKIRPYYRTDKKSIISLDIHNKGDHICILRLQGLGFQHNNTVGDLFVIIINDDQNIEKIEYPNIYLPILVQKPYYSKHVIYRPNMKPLNIKLPYILNNRRVIKGAGLVNNSGEYGDLHIVLIDYDN